MQFFRLPPAIAFDNVMMHSIRERQFSADVALAMPVRLGRLSLARSVSAGMHGDFRSWRQTGSAVSLRATAGFDPEETSGWLSELGNAGALRSTQL